MAYQLREDPEFCAGDRIALLLDNSAEFIAAYYGVLVAGGVVVPLPANIEWCRLERIAELCNVAKVLSSTPTVSRRGEIDAACCRSLDLVSSVPFSIARATPLCIDEQSLAMIMFTSGSSGDPKGVMLSDANILSNARSILKYLPIERDDRALALLPFYHAFGHSIMQTHLLVGATLIVDGNMTFPNSIVDALERHCATSFSAVPEGYYALLRFAELERDRLRHLRYMSVAGGALKSEAVIEMAQRIAPAEFYVMYGQTEATARLAYLPAALAQTRAGSIGQAIPDVELRVFDPDGREVADGETGELCARGANIMLGYWGDREATETALCGGWLHTGDLASRDADGFFHIHARQNDLVKVQGFRLHPREIEDVVSHHFPQLRIIVVPFQQFDATRLALFAITTTFVDGLVDQIRRVCQRELPRHKIPAYMDVLTQAPLNASMKLDRSALARRAACQAGLAPGSDLTDSRPRRKSA